MLYVRALCSDADVANIKMQSVDRRRAVHSEIYTMQNSVVLAHMCGHIVRSAVFTWGTANMNTLGVYGLSGRTSVER